MPQLDGPAAWVTAAIRKYCSSPANTLQNQTSEKAWGTPLVGFSRGDDPLYEKYKQVVGAFHWTPGEIFAQVFAGIEVQPEELTVISWILPQTAATKADNRKQSTYPAERWARSRIFGEAFNDKLRQHIVDVLAKEGVQAVAPVLAPRWESRLSDQYTFASTWSERHAAYASGLGTFGLCDGLITPVGKAMRAGSVVARVQITPTPRPYADHRAYCLFFTDGICGKCITRCPANAITKAGHDKVKCRAHVKPGTEDFVKANYGFDGYGCGMCQTGVPCESKIPTRRDV